jgi:hypothetical protein
MGAANGLSRQNDPYPRTDSFRTPENLAMPNIRLRFVSEGNVTPIIKALCCFVLRILLILIQTLPQSKIHHIMNSSFETSIGVLERIACVRAYVQMNDMLHFHNSADTVECMNPRQLLHLNSLRVNSNSLTKIYNVCMKAFGTLSLDESKEEIRSNLRLSDRPS